MFSLVSRLPSMSSASGFPPLFGHFVGTSRLSDSPTTCMLDFWLMAFSSRPTHNFVSGVDGVSRFSRVEFPCMPGVSDCAESCGCSRNPRLHAGLSRRTQQAVARALWTFRERPSNGSNVQALAQVTFLVRIRFAQDRIAPLTDSHGAM